MNVVTGQFPHAERNRARWRRFNRVGSDQPRFELRCPLQFVNRPIREASTFGNRRLSAIKWFRSDDEANATVVQRGESVRAGESVDLGGNRSVESRALTAVAVHDRPSMFE